METFETHYVRYHTAYDQHTLRLGHDDRTKEEFKNHYVKNNVTFLGFRTNALMDIKLRRPANFTHR